MGEETNLAVRPAYKYTLTELNAFDIERHIALEDAYSMIAAQGDENLPVQTLRSSVESGDLRVYEFKGKKYLDRLDIGRTYHRVPARVNGLSIERCFSTPEVDPLNALGELVPRTVSLTDSDGKTIFQMNDAMFPASWSDVDARIVAQKYFYAPNKEEWKAKLREKLGNDHEFSPAQLLTRVTKFITEKGAEFGYFKTAEDERTFYNELLALQASRKFAFNSPVYFNAGIYAQYGVEGSPGRLHSKDPVTGQVKTSANGENIRPVCHACFINGPIDDLESLMSHAANECDIFSRGSGVGQDISNIRASDEPLSCGGAASGPLSFLVIYDDEAGTIKSGGKSRRAARMTTMRGGKTEAHPDIMEFIRLKVGEDKKALTLMKAGYSPGMDGDAYGTVTMQNTNLSVRLDKGFFEEVERDGEIEFKQVTDGKVVGKISARRMLQEIAYGAWRIGDPGVQYETPIQEDHTCPNSGRINSSNPCSEFMNINDTSCNLGSINLEPFTDEKGKFDYVSFKKASRIAAVALDIINSAASYPVKEIAEISPELRSIGLGFGNLGAVLMKAGMPYDSDAGRKYAASITALMTATALERSAEMARELGTFVQYELNRKPMLKVVGKHKERLQGLKVDEVVSKEFAEEIERTFDNALKLGEVHGYRNSQVSLLAPTGTITFLMGCATTGVEPFPRLSIKKALAGGGSLTLRNDIVYRALTNLETYDAGQIEEIIQYVDKNGVMAGAPYIKPEHLGIFDTAFGSKDGGKRSIPFMAHLKMMGELQKFLSGAISKTVNFPKNASVKDFYDAFRAGNQLGVKAIAAYRTGAKPVEVYYDDVNSYVELKRGAKEELPTLRQGLEAELKFHTEHGEVPVHLIVSEYKDGRPGQVAFLSYKAGSTLGALLTSAGVLVSKALKRGVPIDALMEGWLDQNFEPNGAVDGYPYVVNSKSVLDTAARIILIEYQKRTDLASKMTPVKDETKLRGAQNGAFRTYERQGIDEWNIEDVLKDPELGGFVEGKVGSQKVNGSGKDSGVMCKKCGSIMDQVKPNCYECSKCSNNIGGCTV